MWRIAGSRKQANKHSVHSVQEAQKCVGHGGGEKDTVPCQTLVCFEWAAPGRDRRGLSGRCWPTPEWRQVHFYWILTSSFSVGKGGKKKKRKKETVRPMCPSVQSPREANHGGRLAAGKQLISSTVAVTISSIKVQGFFFLFVCRSRWGRRDISCRDTADKASKHVTDCCSEGQACVAFMD